MMRSEVCSSPAAFVTDMQRLESDALWAREYEDFVRTVSFAGAGDEIGFGAAAALKRLVATVHSGEGTAGSPVERTLADHGVLGLTGLQMCGRPLC